MNAKSAIYKVIQIVDTIPMGITGFGSKTASCVGALQYQRDMIDLMRELRHLSNNMHDMTKSEVVKEISRIELVAKEMKQKALQPD